MSKNAILVGFGGIGKNVYHPQLEQLGYDIDIVDPIDFMAEYSTVNDVPKHNRYEVAVICCPNVHHLNAVLELSDVCNNILVEKPGLANTLAWRNTIKRFPNHRIAMVKNNLYRKNIEKFESLVNIEDVAKIEINWLNKDRIPNPGGWFTNVDMAFGGVVYDLFPHLLCFLYAMLPWTMIKDVTPKTYKMQRWNLSSLNSSDYGEIDKKGVYNVCDYAESHFLFNRVNDEPLPVTLRASWKEGYDDQAIYVHYNDGGQMKVNFGLCPDDAYGRMIENFVAGKFMGDDVQTWHEFDLDVWIHSHLELFRYDNED